MPNYKETKNLSRTKITRACAQIKSLQLTYICGICEEQCSFQEISEHCCCKGFTTTFFDSVGRFYPEKISIDGLEAREDEVLEEDIVNEENLSSNSQQTNNSLWSDKLTEQLIAEVQSREPLWNLKISTKQYNECKEHLWREVEASLCEKVTLDEIKTKFKYLTDSFWRHRNQERLNCKKTGAASKTTKWKFYDHMFFLCKMDLEQQNTVGNYSADDSQLKNDSVEFDEEENNDELATCFSKTNRKKRKHEDDLSKVTVSVCKPSQLVVLPLQPQSPLPAPPDEIKSFALLVENKLRQMDNVRRSDSIKKIINILYH